MFDRDAYNKRVAWFQEARFGMFIHWGLYAIPARGEWIRYIEEIPEEKYMPFFEEFDPVDFEPKKWARAAREAGMKYVVMTAKHHDGFCLFDSQLTDFKSTNTKAGKDLIAEYLEAFRAEGLKVGVYFFTQATDEIEAVEEASYVLDKIKKYRISYPVFLDVEPSGGRGDKIDKATRTAVCKAFCETIQRAGYTAGIYANKTWLSEKMDVGQLNAYKIWLAQYAATPTYGGKYDMWQYTSKGKVSGINGDVDLNISYLGY